MEDMIGFDSYQWFGVARLFSNHQPLFSLVTPIHINYLLMKQIDRGINTLMYTLSKISLAMSLVVLMASVAKTLNILDKRYTVIIMVAAAVIQAILLVLVVMSAIIRGRQTCGVKMTRYQFHDRFVKGNDYILPEYISTTNPRKSAIFKLLVEIKDVSEPPEITISKIGVASVEQDIKNHIVNIESFTVDNSFLLDADIIIQPGEKINFGFKKDIVVKSFFLGELYVP
jgi:hypothetical protein